MASFEQRVPFADLLKQNPAVMEYVLVKPSTRCSTQFNIRAYPAPSWIASRGNKPNRIIA
jgi:hypothetical protein